MRPCGLRHLKFCAAGLKVGATPVGSGIASVSRSMGFVSHWVQDNKFCLRRDDARTHKGQEA